MTTAEIKKRMMLHKTIDDKRRVTLPAEIMEILELKTGDDISFSVTKSGKIVIQKY